MADEDTWRRRFLAYSAVRVGGKRLSGFLEGEDCLATLGAESVASCPGVPPTRLMAA